MDKLTGRVRAAVQKYDMIQAGDKIAVGVSGGKDPALEASPGTTPRCKPCATG